MIARLWAIQIQNGAKVFADVPKKLLEQVAQILIDSGLPEMVPVAFCGTAE